MGNKNSPRVLPLKAAVCGLAILGVVVGPEAAHAMTISEERAADSAVHVRMEGEIKAGDTAKLTAILRDDSGSIVDISLNSLGGNVLEAEQMASDIRDYGVTVTVDTGDTCASACFLLFAAGTVRKAGEHALIGVHSASDADGEETPESLAVTTLIARDAAAYGVPSSIIGKIVTTAPGQIAWLNDADLRRMGVRVSPQLVHARHGVRGLDSRAEYRGVYVCGQGLTALRLRVLGTLPNGRRSVLFSFDAPRDNPGVPTGSFTMQGRLSLRRGVMKLSPVSWVSRPPGWLMVGLNGTSDDGGQSFHGEIVGGFLCTTFSVARVR